MNFEKDAEKREAMWEKQHEFAADKIYNMRADLGGFFLPQGINSINPFYLLHFQLFLLDS